MTLPTLFVFGDSTSMRYGPSLQRATQGVFDYSRKGGPAQATQDLEIPQGANGGDSSACLVYLQARLDADVPPADVLLLNCGLHDLKRNLASDTLQVPPDQYEKNLYAILSLPVARHTVWVRSTPVDDDIHRAMTDSFVRLNRDVDAYNDIADRVMSDAGIPSIDLHRFSLGFGPTGEILPDGRHFQPAICEQQGAYLAGWLDAFWNGRS